MFVSIVFSNLIATLVDSYDVPHSPRGHSMAAAWQVHGHRTHRLATASPQATAWPPHGCNMATEWWPHATINLYGK